MVLATLQEHHAPPTSLDSKLIHNREQTDENYFILPDKLSEHLLQLVVGHVCVNFDDAFWNWFYKQ